MISPSDENEHKTRGRKSNKIYGYKMPRSEAPAFSAADAVIYIQSRGQDVSRQWILKKAREDGPEGPDGILGWVRTPYDPTDQASGTWVPRHKYEAGENERLAVYFDLEELDRWLAQREKAAEEYQEQKAQLEEVVVSDEIRQQIKIHKMEAADEHGGIVRTRLRDILMEKYGYSDRIYRLIQKVAEDESWPYPASMPRRPKFKNRRAR